MELKEFVARSLTDIADGIAEAQKNARNGFLVSPPHWQPNPDKNHVATTEKRDDTMERVDFDVLVTTSADVSGGGKMGIFVADASLDGKVSWEKASRIKFHVYVRWPRQTTTDLETGGLINQAFVPLDKD